MMVGNPARMPYSWHQATVAATDWPNSVAADTSTKCCLFSLQLMQQSAKCWSEPAAICSMQSFRNPRCMTGKGPMQMRSVAVHVQCVNPHGSVLVYTHQDTTTSLLALPNAAVPILLDIQHVSQTAAASMTRCTQVIGNRSQAGLRV